MRRQHLEEYILVLLKQLCGKRANIRMLVEWLQESDYFSAPASAAHHLSLPGGLARHSLRVYQNLASIADKLSLGISRDSLIICGLLHDLCKVGIYIRQKNGTYREHDPYPLGHGEKSVILIQRYIHLSPDESLSIRWHMGAWEAEGPEQRRTLNAAIAECVLLRALMIADQLAVMQETLAEATSRMPAKGKREYLNTL